MASNRSRAMPDRSRIAAISTNIGTETKMKDETKLNTRLVISGTAIGPNQPRAKISATRSVTKASGMPVRSNPNSMRNITRVP